MSTTKAIPTQQNQQKQGIRKIMTWNSRKSNRKYPQLSYDSAPEGDDPTSPAPASPTPSSKSLKSGRSSLFATFARRNSTKSEHSSRSRSPPTSPRPSNDNIISDEICTPPSPTPSRNSMIFERDIEIHDHLSVHEAIDLAIPPIIDKVFVNDEIPVITENGTDSVDGKDKNGLDNIWANNSLSETEGRTRLSVASFVDTNNRPPSPGPFDLNNTIAETLRVTTPREIKGMTGLFDNHWK